MTTFVTGRKAEALAAEYLRASGFTVLAQNYRTRWCEIDIIAQKDHIVHFVEVKYRQSDKQGSGLEYITDKKLRQMAFAAEFWLADMEVDTAYVLSGLEVTGDDFVVTDFIESLT
jgi:uncharacterized protein (TIGR00252 family)